MIYYNVYEYHKPCSRYEKGSIDYWYTGESRLVRKGEYTNKEKAISRAERHCSKYKVATSVDEYVEDDDGYMIYAIEIASFMPC